MNRKYRKTIIAGNWKMNLLPSQVKPFGEKLKAGLGQQRFCQVVLCVPAVMIPAAVRAFRAFFSFRIRRRLLSAMPV